MKDHWGDHLFTHDYQKPFKKFRWRGIPLPDKVSRRLLTYGGLHHHVDQWYDDTMSQAVSELHQKHEFDAVVVEYIFLSKALEALPDHVLKVIDTHDQYSDRVRQFTSHNLYPEWFFTSAAEERKGLSRAHVVIAIQTQEEQFFRSLLSKDKKILTVGHLAPTHALPDSQAYHALRLGYVAGRSTLNERALEWFMKNVWYPHFADQGEIELHIFGSICDALSATDNQLFLHGVISDPKNIYQQADLFLNPVQAGTGLKIKSAEALAHGKYLLATPTGLAGLEEAISTDCLTENDPEAWVHIIQSFMARNDHHLVSERNRQFYQNYLAQSQKNLRSIFSKND